MDAEELERFIEYLLPSYGVGRLVHLKCEGAPYFGPYETNDSYIEKCLDELQKLWDAEAMASAPAGCTPVSRATLERARTEYRAALRNGEAV